MFGKRFGKMKHLRWTVIGLVIVCLAVVTLSGCGAGADYAKLEDDYAAVKADYEAASKELAEIKQVYPPRDFTSISELEDWLAENDMSERAVTEYADAWYRKALQVQEDALKDGYIVSADYDYYEVDDTYDVYCVAIIDGDIWYWDPETDEPLQDDSLGKVK